MARPHRRSVAKRAHIADNYRFERRLALISASKTVELSDLARTILFGTTLEEKLLSPRSVDDREPSPALEAPARPGRPVPLSRFGKSPMPSRRALETDIESRARLLHAFANHELLALELMALALLKFPDAPEKFRRGLYGTLKEEQEHLGWYLERLKKLGASFGDFPVNGFIWKLIRNIRSPAQFVASLNLTFEQANLDYAKSYSELFAEIGDGESAALLSKIHEDEIRHVHFGVVWLDRMAAPGASLFDRWRAELPEGISVRRARGIGFSREGRERAGLGAEFIDAVETSGGSRGRPPAIWLFNTRFEEELSGGKLRIDALADDLSHLPLFLAREGDRVLSRRKPSDVWLRSMAALGFAMPEFAPVSPFTLPQRCSSAEPWGWSDAAMEVLAPLKDRMTQHEEGTASRSAFEGGTSFTDVVRTIASKRFAVEFLERRSTARAEPKGFERRIASTPEELDAAVDALSPFQTVLFKACRGASGSGHRLLRNTERWRETLSAWVPRTLEHGGILVEPLLHRIADFSRQMIVTDGRPFLFPPRRFLVDGRFHFQGTVLNRALGTMPLEIVKYIHSKGVFDRWDELTAELAAELRGLGFRGPAGIDAFIYRNAEGDLSFQPLTEINPRYTMSRIALEFERLIVPSVPAVWRLLRDTAVEKRTGMTLPDFIESYARRYPVVRDDSESRRVRSGVIVTSDPTLASRFMTVLTVGEASEDPVWQKFFAGAT